MSLVFSPWQRNLHVQTDEVGTCLLLQNCEGRGLTPRSHTHTRRHKHTHTQTHKRGFRKNLKFVALSLSVRQQLFIFIQLRKLCLLLFIQTYSLYFVLIRLISWVIYSNNHIGWLIIILCGFPIPETCREVPLSSTIPLTSLKMTLWPVWRPCGWLSMQVTTPGLPCKDKRDTVQTVVRQRQSCSTSLNPKSKGKFES